MTQDLKYSSPFHGIRVWSVVFTQLAVENGGRCDWAYREVNELGGPVLLGVSCYRDPKL